MKAAVVTATGLEVSEVAMPKLSPTQVLTRVRAASLNRADLAVVSGQQHGRVGGPGTIPGLDWAGDVVAVGGEVTNVAVGDRVMCSGSGGYAEYALSDWGRTVRIPSPTMSYEEAATLPVALQTMHDAIITNGRLKPGESILIQGASSGVGLMGLQIARRMGARLVLGSSTNGQRRSRLTDWGAHHAIDTSRPNWSEEVLALTEGKGVDLIVDQVSAPVANENMKAVTVRGRIVNVGRLGGVKGEFDFDLHALKRIDYIGVTFRTRTPEEVREINRRMRADLWADVADGRLRLPVDRTFRLDDVAAAVAHMRANAHFGKVLLVIA